ncbi:YlxM family DNA-binding protein [Caloramator sp. E03]|uniref:YlxM family DNA-binding protein n=1 Tax=Caloramator sp. E03 TaxID=2576307 RepID=UPI001FAA5043|nr:YlxM family DNA-binding protein [Caloramator sp. E03]
MIDKFSEKALLLDFYGGLLTDKQRMFMSLHYEEDMSLSEISNEFGVSRQAVHDIIKRSEKILEGYEKELGLVNRFMIQREKLKKVKTILADKINDIDIKKAMDIIDELIDV